MTTWEYEKVTEEKYLRYSALATKVLENAKVLKRLPAVPSAVAVESNDEVYGLSLYGRLPTWEPSIDRFLSLAVFDDIVVGGVILCDWDAEGKHPTYFIRVKKS